MIKFYRLLDYRPYVYQIFPAWSILNIDYLIVGGFNLYGIFAINPLEREQLVYWEGDYYVGPAKKEEQGPNQNREILYYYTPATMITDDLEYQLIIEEVDAHQLLTDKNPTARIISRKVIDQSFTFNWMIKEFGILETRY